jgi:hypothetical protein
VQAHAILRDNCEATFIRTIPPRFTGPAMAEKGDEVWVEVE